MKINLNLTMSFRKNSHFLLQKSKWIPKISKITGFHSKQVHQKASPWLSKEADGKLLEELKQEENVPAKADRIPRSVFGATILPQNLSYENSRKLTENKVRLEDIPMVDENHAEAVLHRKLKGKMEDPHREIPEQPKEPEKDTGVIVIETSLMKQSKFTKKSPGDLLWATNAYEDIPGPRAFPSFFNAIKTSTRQLTIASLLQLVKSHALMVFKAYGPIVRVPEILGGRIVLISRPEHMHAILEQDHRYPVNSILDSLQRCRLHRHEKGEQTRYHLNESEWNALKKSVKNPLMRGLEKYFDDVDNAASKFSRRIKQIRNHQDEVPDDFLYEINKWSLECLCHMLFDKSYGYLDNDSNCWSSKTSGLLSSLTIATKNLCRLETGFQFWRFMNTSFLYSLSSACTILESNISQFVAQVQLDLIRKKENSSENSSENSFQNLSLVEGQLLEENSSPDEIVSNILDTLIIGVNTMSITLGFFLYHLSKNPQVQKKLFQEVREILPEKYCRLEYDQVNSLKYLQACLRETLRLHMPIPVLNRVLSKNVVLNNYQVPKGTFVLMTPQVEGLKEENFNDPNTFFPERWLDHEFSHPYTNLPIRNYFTDGIERRMAEMAFLACASQIVRQFSVDYYYEDIEATNTVFSFPNKPLKFTLTERKN